MSPAVELDRLEVVALLVEDPFLLLRAERKVTKLEHPESSFARALVDVEIDVRAAAERDERQGAADDRHEARRALALAREHVPQALREGTVPFDVTRADQEERLLRVARRGEEDDPDRDDGEPRLARSDATGHLGLVGLDLLDRQRAPVLQAAPPVVLHPSRTRAARDEEKRGDESRAACKARPGGTLRVRSCGRHRVLMMHCCLLTRDPEHGWARNPCSAREEPRCDECRKNDLTFGKRRTSTKMHVKEPGLPGEFERRSSQWQLLLLAVVVLATTAVRVWVIRHFPEPDGDAKGHLGIADRAALRPAERRGALGLAPRLPLFPRRAARRSASPPRASASSTARSPRCCPFLVWRYGERTLGPSASKLRAPRPLPRRRALRGDAHREPARHLGAAGDPLHHPRPRVRLVDRHRPLRLGGGMLAVAAMVRYEAWGAVGLLAGLRASGFFPAVVNRLPAPLARACRLPLVVVVPSLLAIGGWFLAHRLADGTWLGFLRELYRYTHVQRGELPPGPMDRSPLVPRHAAVLPLRPGPAALLPGRSPRLAQSASSCRSGSTSSCS